MSLKEKLHALPKERANLLRLLREERSRQAREVRPYPRPVDTAMPLSWAQQRLWFIDQLEGGTAAYNMTMAMRLHGELSCAALQKALDRIVERHEALRTVFVYVDGDPRQTVLPPRSFALSIVDLTAHPEEQRATQVRQHKVEEARGIFDMSAGPLIRGRLLQVAHQQHVLLITMHHVICDGWSLGVFTGELSQLYESYLPGNDDPLPPLPIQYADYAQWQREWLQAEQLERQLTYWRARLQGAMPQLELPTDRPRPAVRSYCGGNIGVALDAQLTARLRAFAQRRELTLFMVLHAGWAILLSRLSGQEDLSIGTPVANRRRPEFEGLIGFFVNTLVLRVQAPGDLSVSDFLEQVKEVTLGAYDHQDVPFERVVDALQPERSLSRNPLFQVVFALQNAPRKQLRLPAVTATLEEDEYESALFDLMLLLEEHGDQIGGSVHYATDLYDRETIEHWIASLAVVLTGMLDDPQTRIGDLPILPQHEWQRVTRSFGAARAAYPQDVSIHELFEAQVARTPDAIAVTFEGAWLTYSQLNERANQLARYLMARGVAADRLVGLCLERSMDMVVGLLAILKAGGAYLPLDPNYPTERIAYMLQDAAPGVLLTQERLKDRLPSTAAQIVAVDADWHAIEQHAVDDIPSQVSGSSPHKLAYVIYTSGSTGEPKGVMVEHRNVVRLFGATQQWFEFGPEDVWTLFHSISFDFSVWELWGALLYGGRVIVVPHLTARSPADFYRLLCEQGVTVLNQTPSAFMQLIEAQAHSTQQHSLRVVIFGGEALEPRALRPWTERNGTQRPQLVNMYGITETTVHVTYRLVTSREIDGGAGSPIGAPIPDLCAYVLDPRGQPVPIGVIGEMYIGGAGVVRGYLNRPQLTAQRFLVDRFSVDAQARLYKTGDLARWRADGTLEYLGRNDHQVKIRGFRIEPGEIEAELIRHGQVKEAVVVALGGTAGGKRLVAYVIPADSSTAAAAPTPESLRAHLAAVLPEHMVPAAFVLMERFPLTANGKLDRAALPLPDQTAVGVREYAAPRNELECALCETWAQALGLPRVGIYDNFFAIGGDSILSLRVLAHARASGITFGVADLFRNQTVAQLAHAIEAGTHKEAVWRRVGAFELLTGEERAELAALPNIVDAYPLSQLQEGMYFHSELSPASAVYHDVLSFCLETGYHENAFAAAVRALLDRHPILRTGFTMSCQHRLLQIVHGSTALQIASEDISHLGSCEQRRHIQEWIDREKYRHFAWSTPPLLRMAVHVRGPDRFQYNLSFHHAILDGWSLASLQTELLSDYFSRIESQQRVPVPPKALYRNYIARERQALQSVQSQDFWREQLAGASRSLLPRSAASAGRSSVHAVEECSVPLEAGMGARLESRAQNLAVQVKTLLLVAHVKVMSLICAEQSVITGMVSHGRLDEEDGERVLGLHLNSLPIRVDLDECSWRDLAVRLRTIDEAMLPHRYYPLAAIQELVGSEQLFETLFNFTRFHVFKEIERTGRVSEISGFEQTSFSLLANFSQELNARDIALSISFDPAVLDRRQVERIGGYYCRALSCILKDIDGRHCDQSLLAEAEQHQLLVQFNDTKRSYPCNLLVHQLFEMQAARTPDAIAVEHEDQSLSYAQLNARANQLARYLRQRHVGGDQLVAIHAERSLHMIVMLLGTLKAGGAYQPLDPHYPAERLQYMLDDGDPGIVLTQAALLPALPSTRAETVPVDRDWSDIERYATENLSADEAGLSASNLVYVIYTSGSTGRPKGTAMTHSAMVNLIEWHREIFDDSTGTRVLQFAALSFDVAFQDIFTTLCTGGTLVLLDEWVRRDARALAHFLGARRIARLFVPPLMLQSLAEVLQGADAVPANLRDIITAGEQLRISPEVRELFERFGACRLHNHYGPTESHVVTGLTLDGAPAQWPQLPSIGRPIPNTQIYLLDRWGQPVPLGVSGELYIGGAGVAREYLRRPELTAQRFIASPFSGDSQLRLYKTGDLARWRDDGSIEYLGRNDDQVKIRGYRIELAEVEAQLSNHPHVREVAVVMRADAAGERRMVAYTAANAGATLGADELRSYLQRTLPDYMVPSAFVVLEGLPRTPSGKLDRRALPTPPLAAYTTREYEAPCTDVERIMATIWRELLKLERIGRRDHFFELGGHSLLAMRVLSRLRQLMHVDLPLKALFDSPTLEELSTVIEVELQRCASDETRRISTLAGDLRQDIDGMSDKAVLARVAELEAQLGEMPERGRHSSQAH